MEQDFLQTKKLLLEYINLIIQEYPFCNKEYVLDAIQNDKELIKFNTTDTVTFLVSDGVLLLPKSAYQLFAALRKNEKFGTNKENYRHVEDYLDTSTTYREYIDHVIECGISIFEYFKESLLHEAMHVCGSGGGSPLEEGINELKSRELAQKYNITIAAYGYSKEVEIAKRLQQIIGKDVMDELTFIPRNNRIDFLINRVGRDKAMLYRNVGNKMFEDSAEYYERLGSVNNPFEKAELYDVLDYSEVHQIIDNYIKENSDQVRSQIDGGVNMIYEVGMLCKHSKGKDLLEKNIYRIEALGVAGTDIDQSKIEYYGDGDLLSATNLVVYSNIFQEGKMFCREYEDLASELSDEKKLECNQLLRVQPLSPEEIEVVQSEEFIAKKQEAVAAKFGPSK